MADRAVLINFKQVRRSSASRHRRVFQAFRYIRGLQRADQFVEIAVNHAIKIMKRQTDAMIGDAVLWKVVSANFLFSPTSADLAAALRAVFFGFLVLLSLQ